MPNYRFPRCADNTTMLERVQAPFARRSVRDRGAGTGGPRSARIQWRWLLFVVCWFVGCCVVWCLFLICVFVCVFDVYFCVFDVFVFVVFFDT